MYGAILYIYVADGIVGYFLLVGNEDDGVALLMQFVKKLHDFYSSLGIKRSGWLVG